MTETAAPRVEFAGGNHVPLQRMMQTQRETGNHVLHPDASDSGISCWELWQLPTGTGRQRVMTATAKQLKLKTFAESIILNSRMQY